MSRDRRPLRCALCGMPRWNDEEVSWLGSTWDDREPFCTDPEAGCAAVEVRRLAALERKGARR